MNSKKKTFQDYNSTKLNYLIICFCADWCLTCKDYKQEYLNLSKRFCEHIFYWIDIEDYPEILEYEDIENFPTLLIQVAEKIVFFGSVFPYIKHLERLIRSIDRNSPIVSTKFPDNLVSRIGHPTIISLNKPIM